MHTTGLSEPEVWEAARIVLEHRPDQQAVRGRADFEAGAAIQEGLQVVRDDVPFPRHTAIAGWPAAGDEEKTRRQEMAKRLAQVARLHLPPYPSGVVLRC
ncbi:MAG: hypothetical protein ACRD2F_02295 [Terriglobales bacterium]